MSGSTTNLDLISSSQASKEVTANALFDAESPAALYGRRASTTANLTWGYYGGALSVNGVVTAIANGTKTLTNAATNYLEADPTTGNVAVNTSNFTTANIPLYSVVTSGNMVTSYVDYRTGPGFFADRSGSSSQTFKVATATQANQATRLDQMLYPFRNVAVNGDMSVSQVNGTTLVTTGNATDTYVIDQMIVNAATAAVTAGQSTDATGLPAGFRTNLKISGAVSNTGVKIKHRIEAKDVAHFASRKIAISFWAYQDSGAAFASATVKAFCPTTTADTFSALTQEGSTQTISIANAGTIAKYTAFITMGAANVAKGLEIEIDTAAALLAGKTMYVTGLQIEAVVSDATVGTEFEFCPYARQLARCQRFLPYIRLSGGAYLGIAFAGTTTHAYGHIYFPVPTRILPTAVVTSTASEFSFQTSVAYNASALALLSVDSDTQATIDMTSTGMTALQPGFMAGSAGGFLYFTGAQL